MKQRGVFLIGLILIVIYFFLFPRPAGLEYVLSPAALIPFTVQDPGQYPSFTGPARFVRGRGIGGFLNKDFSFRYALPSALIVGGDDWSALAVGNEVEIRDVQGNLVRRLRTSALPLSSGGRLFLHDSERGIVEEREPRGGVLLWNREFLSPVTVLKATETRTLIGLLDGRALIFDRKGELLFEYRSGGSRVTAVYGGALSPDGGRIALITGLHPQRFILLEERKNGFRPASHHETGTDFRRAVPVSFISGGGRVLYESKEGVFHFDPPSGKSGVLDIPGRPMSWVDDEESGILLLVSGAGGRIEIRLLSDENRKIFQAEIAADDANAMRWNNHILITADNTIMVLEEDVR